MPTEEYLSRGMDMVKHSILIVLLLLAVKTYAAVTDVRYKNEPITVNASRNAINVIKLPYPITFIDSSIQGLKVGKGEKEFSITISQAMPTDLAIMTTNKTFIVTLQPVLDGAAVINISDNGIADDEDMQPNPYLETLSDLYKAAYMNKDIRGYYKRVRKDVYKIDDGGIISEDASYEGVRYIIHRYTFYNNKSETVFIGTDSPDIERIMKIINSDKNMLSIAVDEEEVKPKTSSVILIVTEVK